MPYTECNARIRKVFRFSRKYILDYIRLVFATQGMLLKNYFIINERNQTFLFTFDTPIDELLRIVIKNDFHKQIHFNW